MFKPPGQCPVCGEWVPRRAVACEGCGACARSGWRSEEASYDGLDLPDEDAFDYDRFIEEEFGESSKNSRSSRESFWRWVALILLAVLVFGCLWGAL